MLIPYYKPKLALRLLFWVFILSVPALHARAQSIKPFPKDTAGFASSFQSFMSLSHLTDQQRQSITRFIGMVSSDSAIVSPEKRDLILYSLNRMKSRRARQVPLFTDYVETILLLNDKKAEASFFDAWEKGLNDLLDNRRSQMRYIQRYLSGVLSFLRSFELIHTRALSWKTDPVNFQFHYDKGFYIQVDKTTLTCHAQRDSIIILETAGKYYPYNALWYGKSGKVTWERAGYPRDSVFAILPPYKLNLLKDGYHVDSVSFINRSYFQKPILGTFDDKTSHISTPARATYPKFDSYVKRFMIRNLYPHVDYEGGFSMQGAVINGTGDVNHQAVMSFYRNDTLQLKVRSLFFAIHKDRASGRETAISFYMDKDSVYHPNIAFSYNNPAREVSLYQTDNMMTKSPYYDTYHKLNIQANRFVWKTDKPVALFTRLRGTTIGEGYFWSTNFFSAKAYFKMQGMAEQHPLYMLKKFADWYYSDDFPVEELAKWMHKPEYQVRRLIVQLAVQGFVFYNPETGEVKLKKELYDYLDAFAGKIDYDVMYFLSRTRAPVDNAVIDLHNFNMTINGVPTIFLSDSQNVAIYPAQHRIVMHRNRSFSFDGEIQAGMSILNGKNFFFNYDTFKIDLYQIDSMRLTAFGDSTDNLGRPVAEKIKNTLEVVTGSVFIDKPDNKSGLKHYDKYPYFQSTDSSFVFYDKASVYDSIYTRKDFYFVIRPFTLYSLNNLHKEDLSFKGDFISGKIFPSIPQKLVVQPDNSLGFVSDVPENGIAVYDGKGRYYNKVELSNMGLEGAGKLTYLTATVRSDKFSFFPDSMTTDAHDLAITATHEGTRYPDVKTQDVRILWLPRDDKFHIYKKSTEATLFNDQYKLDGNMTLTPDYLEADGRINFSGSVVSSNRFLLTDNHFEADTAHFVLPGTTPDMENKVDAESLRANVDISGQTADFECLVDTFHINFPDIQWITSLDAFTFDFANKQIFLVNNKTTDDPYLLGNDPFAITGKWVKMPTFISMNPKTDTLGFYTDSAQYDLNNETITATHTEFLEVADALIYPNGMTVRIKPNGNLEELSDAKIVAAGTYSLDSARVNIFSRKKYFGAGLYKYTQDNGETEDIYFTDISVNDSLHTHAETDLPPEKNFMLSPYFSYTGKVELIANKEHLIFTGGAGIVNQCKHISNHYLAFSSEIDPDNIMIPVSEQMRDIHKKKIYCGHFITNDSTHIYPAFLSPRIHYSDQLISRAQGVLYYDKKTGEYRIGSEEKVLDPSLPGNYVSFERNYCKLYAEGLLDPGVRFGQVKSLMPGNILEEMDDSSNIRLHVMIGLDFYFDPEALKIMAQEIDSLTTLQPVDVRSGWYGKTLEELGGKSKMTAADIQEMKMFGQVPTVPKEQKHTLFLSDVTLEWDQDTRSYISTGKIGLGNVNGYPLNVAVEGYLEIQKKRSGDVFDLYLKLNGRDFYYFAYTPGVLQSISNNYTFNSILSNLKESKRKLKVRSGQPPYMYMLGVERKKTMFLRKMQMIKETKNQQ